MEDLKKRILIIDDDILTLHTGRNALQPEYAVTAVQYAKDLHQALDKIKPDLIFLDTDMPGLNPPDLMERLRSNPDIADVPVIFLYDKASPGDILTALSQGAADTLVKPFLPALLRKKAELHLRTETLKAHLRAYAAREYVTALQDAVISWAADLLEFREDVTGRHAENVQKYLKVFTEAAANTKKYGDEISRWDVDAYLHAAILHDVGKIKIRDEVLLKRGRLTEEEFETLKLHTLYGKILLESLPHDEYGQSFVDYATDIAYMHHEKWDGTGYPGNLKAEEIPLQVRMLAIVDVYDALVSERPYKKAFSHDEAMRIIYERRGTQFDPGLTDLFMSLSHELHE